MSPRLRTSNPSPRACSPREHVHDYGRVADLLRACRRRGEEEEEEEEDADRRRSAPASASDSDETDGARDFVDPLRRLCLPPAGYSNSGNTCFAASASAASRLHHARAHRRRLRRSGGGSKREEMLAGIANHHAARRAGIETALNRRFCCAEYCPPSAVARGASMPAGVGSRRLRRSATARGGKIARHFVRAPAVRTRTDIRSLLDAICTWGLKEHMREGTPLEGAGSPVTQGRLPCTTSSKRGYTCGRRVGRAARAAHESRTSPERAGLPDRGGRRRPAQAGVLGADAAHPPSRTARPGSAPEEQVRRVRRVRIVAAARGARSSVCDAQHARGARRGAQLGRWRGGAPQKVVEYPVDAGPLAVHVGRAPVRGRARETTRRAPSTPGRGGRRDADAGSANSGHYVAFVRLANGTWCKCDDGNVEETTAKTALAAEGVPALLRSAERATRRGRAHEGAAARGNATGGGGGARGTRGDAEAPRPHVAGSPSSGTSNSRTRRHRPLVKVRQRGRRAEGAAANVAPPETFATEDENDRRSENDSLIRTPSCESLTVAPARSA